MARVRSFAALAAVACLGATILHQAVHTFVGLSFKQPQGLQRASSAIARLAAAPSPPPSSGSSDFDAGEFLKDLNLGGIVEESDTETPSRASALFFYILGFGFVPIFKGLTCGLLFAAIAYFAANGSLVSFVGKSESAADYADTAKTVENVAGGVGGYIIKAYNFVAEKVKTATA